MPYLFCTLYMPRRHVDVPPGDGALSGSVGSSFCGVVEEG